MPRSQRSQSPRKRETVHAGDHRLEITHYKHGKHIRIFDAPAPAPAPEKSKAKAKAKPDDSPTAA